MPFFGRVLTIKPKAVFFSWLFFIVKTLFGNGIHCVSKFDDLNMQKYQILEDFVYTKYFLCTHWNHWKHSFSTKESFYMLNTQLYIKVYSTSASHFKNCGIFFKRKTLDTKSINHLYWHNMESLLINIDH